MPYLIVYLINHEMYPVSFYACSHTDKDDNFSDKLTSIKSKFEEKLILAVYIKDTLVSYKRHTK
jgi:hypothetical protein